jgi:hypothetical protein
LKNHRLSGRALQRCMLYLGLPAAAGLAALPLPACAFTY